MKPHELREHNEHIAGICWSFKNDHIVLCWSQKDGVGKLTLLFRITYVTIFLKSSPLENKFAVNSEAQFISVYYLSMKMASG